MSENIEQKCLAKGVKLTEQRKIIAKIMSESNDHPDVDELYNRVSKIDSKISIATVYRTVKLFEESGILAKHEFKGGKARYEELNEGHHDHLIDDTGTIYVNRGPGSFAGIRNALSTIKALFLTKKIDYYCFSFVDFKESEASKYADVPQLCEKYKIKKNLINPIYLS